MIELHTKNDIEKVSLEVLQDSKSFDVFPTPISQIISYTNLIVREDIDVAQIHSEYVPQATDILVSALSKIRGILDRKKNSIYLDKSQSKPRINFVTLHEVGHHILPWQKDLHELLEDDDSSLNSDTHQEFEAEANYFASITLFQHTRFIDELNKYNLSIESGIKLAKHFGASIHATLRRYVEYSQNRCALIVLENMSQKGTPRCNIKDKFFSEYFIATFGELLVPDELGYKWAFVKDYYHKRKLTKNGFISLPTDNGEADFNYHFFYNTYNAFVFVFPIGERKSPQTKILITDNIIYP